MTDGHLEGPLSNRVSVITQGTQSPGIMADIANYYGVVLHKYDYLYRNRYWRLRTHDIPSEWKTEVPILPEHLEPAYIRGLMYGDGTITRRSENGKLRAYFYWVNHEQFLGDFFIRFLEKSSISHGKIGMTTPKVSVVRVNQKDTPMFLTLIGHHAES